MVLVHHGRLDWIRLDVLLYCEKGVWYRLKGARKGSVGFQLPTLSYYDTLTGCVIVMLLGRRDGAII